MLYWDWAIISDRPTVIHRNRRGQLHRDEEAAVAYADGFCVYALNGVRMNKMHVLTRAEALDPGIILREKNVEVRRELIRKVGMERCLSVWPHAIKDQRGNYALLDIGLAEGLEHTRWLKMLNPSIGVWHVEAVAPECSTVQEALNWRAHQKQWVPEILT